MWLFVLAMNAIWIALQSGFVLWYITHHRVRNKLAWALPLVGVTTSILIVGILLHIYYRVSTLEFTRTAFWAGLVLALTSISLYTALSLSLCFNLPAVPNGLSAAWLLVGIFQGIYILQSMVWVGSMLIRFLLS
ncbi:hypothetical protein L207DRAFT_165447 [Hyaloscypha variabilis F]|uniref:Uncharacterized protein n=1 Tax=Hyaloscypha variabilis (strain UAMH 11265 / GT02V1 / F) TaxID=1149755 RepID=A0A2J6SAU4_HYAVF|nr:hypothetical protein L207DRAFT_165447 [Hyaloscypha variabilis F]